MMFTIDQARFLRLLALCVGLISGSCAFAAEEASNSDLVNRQIEWTEIPKVDQDDPTLHRGIVFGPDGTQLAGAKIYAASNIELFEIRPADQVSSEDMGKVRVVTDELGRFEFHTPDLTWLPASGKRKRWEAFLIATKDNLAPGWIKTWGQDRGFRSDWNPHFSKGVTIHLTETAKLQGNLLSPNGDALADAGIEITSINIPKENDLDKHVEFLRKQTPSFFGYSTNYRESVSRPWLIPDVILKTETDANGSFVIEGLPRDSVVDVSVTHPDIRTQKFRVAVREIKDVFREASEFDAERKVVLRGSGFTFKTTVGVKLRGRVVIDGASGQGVSGAIVAEANHNASDGITGKRFATDDNGNFEITGLGPDYYDPGYEIAVIGSFKAPIESKRFTVLADDESKLRVKAAIPYRVKLTDSTGEPINRKVYSMVVQSTPDTIREGPTSRFNLAVKVAPGVYEGIVPKGPGAVLVERGGLRDRPVLVDPKAFFAPGREEWTAAEARYAYGDKWTIAKPGVRTTSALAPSANRTYSQLDMAAVVFTTGNDKGPLELTATVHQDDPPQVSLVDESGKPVVGARMQRQLSKYNTKDLSNTLPIYGLHPSRPELIEFYHDERDLVGSMQAVLTEGALDFEVTMRPVATITGRIVGSDGIPSGEFGILVEGNVAPYTYLGNHTRDSKHIKKGSFGLKVTPGETYSGKWMRRSHYSFYPKPLSGEAFAPVTPKPGEVIDLGDLVMPQPLP